MNTNISFQGLKGFDHHFEFINEQVENTIGKFENGRPIQVTVHIREEVPRKQFREAEITCEVIAEVPGIPQTVVARKTSEDFNTAVRASCHAVHQQLERRIHKRRTLRRHQVLKEVVGI